MITAMFYRVAQLKGKQVEITMSWGERFVGTLVEISGGETCDLTDWQRLGGGGGGIKHNRTTLRVSDVSQIHVSEGGI